MLNWFASWRQRRRVKKYLMHQYYANTQQVNAVLAYMTNGALNKMDDAARSRKK